MNKVAYMLGYMEKEAGIGTFLVNSMPGAVATGAYGLAKGAYGAAKGAYGAVKGAYNSYQTMKGIGDFISKNKVPLGIMAGGLALAGGLAMFGGKGRNAQESQVQKPAYPNGIKPLQGTWEDLNIQ